MSGKSTVFYADMAVYSCHSHFVGGVSILLGDGYLYEDLFFFTVVHFSCVVIPYT